MKKITLIIIVLIAFTSCTKLIESESECDCVRRTYNRVSEQVPNTTTWVVIQKHISTDVVPCQEERTGVSTTIEGYSDPYFDVECYN